MFDDFRLNIVYLCQSIKNYWAEQQSYVCSALSKTHAETHAHKYTYDELI